MRLSIVIPTLQEAGGIVAALSALQALRADGHEVIVVDGGSDDVTLTLARPWVDIALTTGSGRARQMNAGARTAHGNVLLFLHADSTLPNSAVMAIAAAMARGARWGRFDVTIRGQPRILRVVAAMMNLRSRVSGIATGDQGIFVESALFATVGGFPELPLMEDIALSKILKLAAGRPACLAPRIVTSGRRWEKRGPWTTIVEMWRLRAAYALGADPNELARRYGR